MNVIIDYLSVSIKYPRFYTWVLEDESENVKSELMPRYRKLFNLINSAKDLQKGGGRAPFNRSWHSPSMGFTYFESDKIHTSLLEITGQGCKVLRDMGWETSVVRDFADELTRIDIACDIETKTTPEMFCSERNIGRFESYAIYSSSAGQSVYVGSRQSSRFARVYRYHPPHPRAGLLRIEFVSKGDFATTIAKEILVSNVHEVAKSLGLAFGWKHSDWSSELGSEGAKQIRHIPRETRQGSTDRWLLKAVLPSLRKMIEKGNREMVEYFASQLMALLKETK